MADNWEVGDQALCIATAPDDVFEIENSRPVAPGPMVGLTYTVANVSRGFDVFGREGVALRFFEIRQSHPKACGYNSELFRKVAPPEADEFDREVIEHLTGAPVKEKAR